MTPKEQQLLELAHWLNNPLYALLFALLITWTLIWKGIALWKAARNGQSAWFVAFLIVNTVGILEIIYIFFFSKKGSQQSNL